MPLACSDEFILDMFPMIRLQYYYKFKQIARGYLQKESKNYKNISRKYASWFT